MNSLINKTVNIDPSLLSIMFPNYEFKSYVSFLDRDKDIIYIGKPFNNLTSYLGMNTRNFINTIGKPDVDLSNKDTLFEFVLNSLGKSMNNKYKSFLDTVDDAEFNYCLKLMIINKRLPYDISKGSSLFDLYKAMNSTTNDLLKAYHSLLEIYHVEVIESSIMTFLNRVANLQVDGLSPRYTLLIKNTKARIGSKLKPAINNYALSNQTQLDLLSLLLELTQNV